MKRIKFPEKKFLENLLMQEDRDAYNAMTPEQKRIVRFAYIAGKMGVGDIECKTCEDTGLVPLIIDRERKGVTDCPDCEQGPQARIDNATND